jgi:hypothetical protein
VTEDDIMEFDLDSNPIDNTIGASLAKQIGAGRACLLASHGAVVAEETIRRVVLVAINLVTNAELLLQSFMLAAAQDARDLRFLSSGEIKSMQELMSSLGALERMWEYWATRLAIAPAKPLVENKPRTQRLRRLVAGRPRRVAGRGRPPPCARCRGCGLAPERLQHALGVFTLNGPVSSHRFLQENP